MMISSFGPPSGFVQFAISLTRFLTDVVLQDVDYVSATEIQPLRDAWAARRHPHLFFFSDCPAREVVNVFLQSRAPILIIYEEPEDITAFMVRERAMEWLWALRTTNQCLETIADLFREDRVLVIRRAENLDYATFFKRIADHFGLLFNDDDLATVMRNIDATGSISSATLLETAYMEKWPHAAAPGSGLADAPLDVRPVLTVVFGQLRQIVARRPAVSLKWPSEVFVPGDKPNAMYIDAIQMMGPARCLLYGPYLCLAVGIWELSMDLAISENLSGNRLEIDIYIKTVVHSEVIPLPKSGRIAIKAVFPVTDPRDAIQLRLIMREGAIEGVLSISEATLRRVDAITLAS